MQPHAPPPRPTRRALLTVLALAAAITTSAAAGCKDRERNKAAPVTTPSTANATPTGTPLGCIEALEGARELPLHARPLAVATGCAVVCPDLSKLLTTEPLMHRRFVEACGLFCDNKAALQFEDANDRLRWRSLQISCPHELELRAGSERYVDGAWGVLVAIQRWQRQREALPTELATRLDQAIAALWFPLRLVSQIGTGFVLPASELRASAPPTTYVAITNDRMTAGKVPLARLGGEAITVESGETPFPGEEVDRTTLAAALGKLEAARDASAPITMLVAPHKLVAARLHDALAAANPGVLYLGVGSGYPAVHPVPLRAAPTAAAASALRLTDSELRSADRALALDTLGEAGPAAAITAAVSANVLTIALEASATFDSLARVLDAAAGVGAAEVAIVIPTTP